MAWEVKRIEESIGAHKVLVGSLILKNKGNLEDLGVNERIILKRIINKQDEGDVNLIYLAEFGGKWRSFVNAVLKFRVPLNARNFYLAEEILVSQQRLCSIELVGWLVGWLVS
jgi:hypothetical protein